jgi:hypothetical protein
VDALRDAGIETFESCEGGDGHSFPQPAVRFAGAPDEGFRAVAVAVDYCFPVRAIRRYWTIMDGEPHGPDWEITFRWAANDPRSRDRPWHVEQPAVPFVDYLVGRGELQRHGDRIIGPRDPEWATRRRRTPEKGTGDPMRARNASAVDGGSDERHSLDQAAGKGRQAADDPHDVQVVHVRVASREDGLQPFVALDRLGQALVDVGLKVSRGHTKSL